MNGIFITYLKLSCSIKNGMNEIDLAVFNRLQIGSVGDGTNRVDDFSFFYLLRVVFGLTKYS
tara:strand:+ start:170 stop:355 length:186 start_codon:yes stop_codon:yes gene_type:complete